MSLIIQKFGGTSVADADRMKEVADHVKRTKAHGHSVVLVVSAMGKETDHLLRLASEVSQTRPACLLYTSPSPRDATLSRMPSSA